MSCGDSDWLQSPIMPKMSQLKFTAEVGSGCCSENQQQETDTVRVNER